MEIEISSPEWVKEKKRGTPMVRATVTIADGLGEGISCEGCLFFLDPITKRINFAFPKPNSGFFNKQLISISRGWYNHIVQLMTETKYGRELKLQHVPKVADYKEPQVRRKKIEKNEIQSNKSG